MRPNKNLTLSALDDLNKVTQGYIEAIYFTETGDSGQPPPNVLMSEEAVWHAAGDCAEFMLTVAHLLPAWLETQTLAQLGHDFWLTRNWHGAGFWDRNLDELGEQLTHLAQAQGMCDAYLGDDGCLWIS
jgi:hypothetical protein